MHLGYMASGARPPRTGLRAGGHARLGPRWQGCSCQGQGSWEVAGVCPHPQPVPSALGRWASARVGPDGALGTTGALAARMCTDHRPPQPRSASSVTLPWGLQHHHGATTTQAPNWELIKSWWQGSPGWERGPRSAATCLGKHEGHFLFASINSIFPNLLTL